jgi:hypothetical protein
MATIDPSSVSQPDGAVDNAITQLSAPALTAPEAAETDAEGAAQSGDANEFPMDRVLNTLIE